MVAHIQNNHGTKDKKCKFCRIFFVNIRRMSRHITKIHEGQRNYCKCNYCGKSFSESGNLKRHIKNLHEGQKITNVILAENPSLYQEIWRSRQFMKNKDTNVILVENLSLHQNIWRDILRPEFHPSWQFTIYWQSLISQLMQKILKL